MRPPSPLLTVSSPPHAHCGTTIRSMMLDNILALMPAAILAAVTFGMPALRVMTLACCTAVGTEALCFRMMKRPPEVDDFNALLIGLLFAFLLPSTAPWWLVMVGASTTIILGKMIYGGLGGSPFCPPLLGWAACVISWPDLMNPNFTVLDSPLAAPLAQLKYLGADYAASFSPSELLTGQQLGGLGEVQVAALLIGAAYLLLRRRILIWIPLAFLGGTMITALLLGTSGQIGGSPLFHLLAGGTVFGAFFLATDTSSSPVGMIPMSIFGFIAGSLVMIIRAYGIYPDSVPFAILLANLFTPLLDRIRPKPFGAISPKRGGHA